MATKVKPQRVEVNNSPSVGQVLSYISDSLFSWINPSGGGAAEVAGTVVSFSRDMADASNVVTYNHNLGVIPKIIMLEGGIVNGTRLIGSRGSFVTGVNKCLWNSNLSGLGGYDASNVIHLQFVAGQSQTGIIQNLTTTTFDISWTRTGVPASDSFNIIANVIGSSPTTGGSTAMASGTISRNMADASNNQVVPHGLGVVPQYIRFFYTQLNGPTVQISSQGNRDGTNNKTIGAIWSGSLGVVAAGIDSTKSIRYHTAELPQVDAVVSAADSTNFTLAWTKTNLPTGTLLVSWEAYG